jgi:branched-chain amino acid transport system substrate-binding protein
MYGLRRCATAYRSKLVLPVAAVAALALLAAGCGGSGGSSGGGDTLSIYSSFPLQGASRPQTQAMNNGAKLALNEAQGKAGRYKIQFKTLDDSVAQTGNWDPAQTSANARQVLRDKRGAVYLGEYNSGATAISLPITNRGGVPQITVSSSVGLTQGGPGTAPGEPQKYYPTGKRTLVRVAATDNVQGKLLAQLPQQDSCSNVAIIHDKEVFGQGLATVVDSTAKALGLPVVTLEGIDKQAPNYRALAAALASKQTSCFVFTGCTANGAVQLFKDVAQALPAAKLYGGDCVLTDDFFNPKKGGLPASVASRVQITAQVLPSDQYGPAGRKVFADYTKAYGVAKPDTYAIYGYQMMELALTALREVSGQLSASASIQEIRAAAVKALYGLKDHPGALGTISVGPSGDMTLHQLAIYRISNGAAQFERKVNLGA